MFCKFFVGSRLVTCNHGHNILDFLLIEQMFHSPLVKRSVIMVNTEHCLYELSKELLNDLRLRLKILGNSEISRKS